MMWGPAVSQIAADLALEGRTAVVEHVEDMRMDRFDAQGDSPFVDPVALPFPVPRRGLTLTAEARGRSGCG